MENPVITISIALAFINIVGLAVGHYFNKFKVTAICLSLFDLATIITMSKLI